MYKLKFYYIVKDSKGQYYTGYWDTYWSRNKNDAYKFDNKEEIIQILEGEEEDVWVKYKEMEYPCKIIEMFDVIKEE